MHQSNIAKMITVKSFTCNPFSEKSYVLFDESKECVIIDPGFSNPQEESQLTTFIESNQLTPVRLLNTHCHIDHILGNAFVAKTYGLKLEMHEKDLPTLAMGEMTANMYGISYTPSPDPEVFLVEGDTVEFGNAKLDVIFVPGHAPGHIAFISHADKVVINGDVLFRESVGRVDLPGGDAKILVKSIMEKLYTLPDDYVVYNGHTPETTIGHEKKHNMFVKAEGPHPSFA
jgi:glyoxylase-like metal-dependent hydrolase (beta-lactamase superfamily II)